MKQLLLFFILLSCGYLHAQDCYKPTMTLAREYFAKAEYKKATKQFRAALTCDVLVDSIKAVENWIKRSDSMEIVILSTQKELAEKRKLEAEEETRKAQSLALTSAANLAIYEQKDVTKGFRYVQYAWEKYKQNQQSEIAIYGRVYQPVSQPEEYFYHLSLEHTYGVNCVVFSPNGKKICSASKDKTLKIWDSENGKLLANLEGHVYTVTSVVFSPDGKKICSAAGSIFDQVMGAGELKIWDSETGELLVDLKDIQTLLVVSLFPLMGKKSALLAEITVRTKRN